MFKSLLPLLGILPQPISKIAIMLVFPGDWLPETFSVGDSRQTLFSRPQVLLTETKKGTHQVAICFFLKDPEVMVLVGLLF